MLLKCFFSKFYACSIKSTVQSDFDEIEQLKEEQVRCVVQYLPAERCMSSFADRFWEVDNFSDDTECLLVVVCSKIRLNASFNKNKLYKNTQAVDCAVDVYLV